MIRREFVKGDLLIPLYATLQDGAGQPIDLTDTTVAFYMKDAVTDVMKVNAAAATIIDAPTGNIKYDWVAGDVDTLGEYWGWFVRTKGGKTGTHPIGKQLFIVIKEGPVA
jgi:subtilase family serine protease